MAKASSEAAKLGWNFIGPLGRGGQAEVNLAVRADDPDGPRYAFKYLADRGRDRAHERFRQELKALLAIDHPGVIKVVDYAKAPDGLQFYVMEYVEGAQSLRQLMSSDRNPFDREPLKAVNGFIQVAEALGACERQGIVHRDLSPANLLVTPGGDIKLIDFGLCHIENGERLTVTDEAVGTPHYRAPECSGFSDTAVTVRADLYSAGKILWSMITNRAAFDREHLAFNEQSLDRILPDHKMSWHFFHIFSRTIRHDPAERFANAAAAAVEGRTVRRLIVDGYRSLEELTRVCTRCGVGVPEHPYQGKYQEEVRQYFGGQGGPRYGGWVCPYCHHLEFVVNLAVGKSLKDRTELN